MKKLILLFILPFHFYACQTNDNNEDDIRLLNSGVFNVVQKWSQQPLGYSREVITKVPSQGLKKYPVVIVLHGNGGTANSFLNKFNYLNNQIIIAPQGYLRSWNIKKEKSKAPDIDFIKEIVTHVKQFDNVDSENISILGSSNGSALVNQLLIEYDEPSFKKAICKVSQLNTFQYHKNKFWSQSDNFFNIPSVPKKGRKILCLAGSEDNVTNYKGGEGVLGYFFLNAEESAYVFAKAMGYKGEKISFNLSEEGPIFFFKFSYLDGDVVHYRVEGAGHGFGSLLNDANQIIKDFLDNN